MVLRFEMGCGNKYPKPHAETSDGLKQAISIEEEFLLLFTASTILSHGTIKKIYKAKQQTFKDASF